MDKHILFLFFAIQKFVAYIKLLVFILCLLFASMFNIRNAQLSVHEFIQPLIWQTLSTSREQSHHFCNDSFTVLIKGQVKDLKCYHRNDTTYST